MFKLNGDWCVKQSKTSFYTPECFKALAIQIRVINLLEGATEQAAFAKRICLWDPFFRHISRICLRKNHQGFAVVGVNSSELL